MEDAAAAHPMSIQPQGAVGAERLRHELQRTPPKRIIVLARDFIGDVVNTTGAIRRVIERFPDAQITVEVGRAGAAIVERIPGVAEVWPREKHQGLGGKVAVANRIRRGRFDLGIIFDDSNEMIRILRLAGVPLRVGARKTKHFEWFTASVPFTKSGHDLFDTLRGVLSLLGAGEDIQPIIDITPEEWARAAHIVSEAFGERRPRIGIHPGASTIEKQWPVEKYCELAERLGHVLVLYGPGEEALAQQVRGAKLPVKLSLFEYAAVAGELDVLITNDTGPAHLAAAMGTRQIVVYGPTLPERFQPWGDQTIAIRQPNNCDYYAGLCEARGAGARTCDRRCLQRVGVEEVVKASGNLLTASAKVRGPSTEEPEIT